MTTMLNNVYNGVKGFFAISLGMSSIPLFLSIVNYPLNIVIGVFDIIITIMLLVDTGITSKIIKELGVQIDRLDDENLEYERNNTNLEKKLKSLKTDLVSLKKMNNNYEKNNKELSKELTVLSKQNKLFDKEINKLEKNNGKLLNQINTLNENNGILDSHVKQLVNQIDGLKIVQNQSKLLIASLMNVGDDFSDFSESLVGEIDRIENISDAMDILLNKLAYDKFDEIDLDGDGTLTRNELLEWAKKHNNKF